MVITTQPENYYGTVGGTATFTVAASGDRVTYQWQRSTDDGETWSNISGGTSTTLSIPIQASVNGNLYRCIAKDYMGHIATSQAGKLTVTSALSTLSEFEPEFTVINESDDYYGRPGDIATFIVEAEGANLSYQWLCRAPGANNFEYLTSSDATTNTLRVEMTAESNGAEYRCFITDANGDVGSTRIATVKLDILDWEMEYNTSGIRTKRVSEEKTYNYIYAGDKLMRMTVGNDTLNFSYDTNGVPLTMTYNGTVYYYITNLQGAVISLELADGGSGAQYAYDAWGNIIAMSGTLAELNPLRYRGYVYDQETGFYYLNSRYYDPAVGRFINADRQLALKDAIGTNLFAYCFNNPVSLGDGEGNWPKWVEKVACVASVVVTVAAVAVTVAAVSAFTAGTGSALAVYGASIFLGAALSGLNGTIANASQGNSYISGYVGGASAGATQAAASKLPGGTIWGGAGGTGIGTAITMGLNNLDPDSSNSSGRVIAHNVVTSTAKATVTSSITAFWGNAIGGINYNTGAITGAASNGSNGLMPTLTVGFAEGFKAFWGAVDDAFVYVWG